MRFTVNATLLAVIATMFAMAKAGPFPQDPPHEECVPENQYCFVEAIHYPQCCEGLVCDRAALGGGAEGVSTSCFSGVTMNSTDPHFVVQFCVPVHAD